MTLSVRIGNTAGVARAVVAEAAELGLAEGAVDDAHLASALLRAGFELRACDDTVLVHREHIPSRAGETLRAILRASGEPGAEGAFA